MDVTKGLGKLSVLPAELRELVFREALGPADNLWLTSIFTVSRAFFHEAEPLTYRGRRLQFELQPPSQPSVRCTDFDISDNYGTVLGYCASKFLQAEIVEPHRSMEPIRNYPFKRLDKIEVLIEGPTPEEPGQFVALWKHIVWITEMLSKSESLPTIEVTFVEGRKST